MRRWNTLCPYSGGARVPTPLFLFPGKHDEYKIFTTKGWVPIFPSSECQNLFVSYLSFVVSLFSSFPNILNVNVAHFHIAVRKSMTTWRYRRCYSQRIVGRLWFSQTKSKGGQGHFVATSLNAKMSSVQNIVRISYSFFYSSAFGSVWSFLEKRMRCVVQNVQPLEANTWTVQFVYVH